MIAPPKSSPSPVPFRVEDTRQTSSDATSPQESWVASESPTIALEIESCDECGNHYAVNLLWPILGRGLWCIRCVDELRLEQNA